MFRTLFRSVCIIAGISLPLTAQEAVEMDSAGSPVVQDTAVASGTVLSQTPVAGGRILNSSDYISGKMDGERDAQGKGIWFVAGLPGVFCYCIGLCGIFISYVLPPSPPEAVFIGKSGEYILGYTEGYKNKGRLKNAKYASLGCLAGTAIETAFYVVFVLLMEQSY
jgi:hypothetical protein